MSWKIKSVRCLLGGVRRFSQSLRRRPLAVLSYVAALACGLTACLVVYAILDFFFLRPLPFKDADRLVAIGSTNAETRATALGDPVGRRGWEQLSANAVFEGVGGWSNRRAYWGHPAEDFINRWSVTSSLFDVLGLKAAVGRLFIPEEDKAPSDVALVSWECWRRRFGGRPDILGQTVTVTDAYTPGALPEVKRIVGVLPQGFRLQGDPPEVVLPIGSFLPGVGSFYLVARLATGVRVETAEAVASSILMATARSTKPQRGRVIPLRDALAAELAPPVWMLVTVAGLLLLVAAFSAAGQLLNELLGRRYEFGVRFSLGADRIDVGAELIVEHVLRSALAAVSSIGLTYLLLRVITSSAPPELMGNARPTFNYRILLWGLCGSAVLSLLLGIVAVAFGVASSTAPARVASTHLMPRRLRMLKTIAILQLAISLVLLVGATLLGRTLANLNSKPIGFDPSNVAVVSFRTTAYPRIVAPTGTWAQFASWIHTDDMLKAIDGVPGVISSAAVSLVPFGSGAGISRIRTDSSSSDVFEVNVLTVTKGYWKTLGIPILKGRLLDSQDRRLDVHQTDGQLVVSLALDRFLGGNSIGRHLLSEDRTSKYEIVGVVGDTKQHSLAESGVPAIYVLSYTYDGVQSIVVRTSRAPGPLLPAIVRTVRDYDRSVLITKTTTMSSLVSASLAAERFRASLAIVIGAIALGLASFGMFLLGLRFVEIRRREIAMRVALGATSRDVLKIMLRDTASIVAAAVIVGWPASYLAGLALRRFLFGVSWIDPVSLVLQSVILGGATLLATLGPARLALRVDPAEALRSEG